MPQRKSRFAGLLEGIEHGSPRKDLRGGSPRCLEALGRRRRRILRLGAFGIAGSLALATRLWAAEGESALGQRLEQALAAPALSGARVSALVVRASDGEVIWSRNPETLLIPASNMKVLTALAALEVFGPTHRFDTRILADKPIGSDGAVAQLGVRGAGDPAINSEDWWRLADRLRQIGLRRVEGDLLVDDSAFDAEFWHPSWGEISARAYHAPVGALTANYGAFFTRVGPGPGPGQWAEVELDPPVEYLQLLNQATTAKVSERTHLKVHVQKNSGPPEREQVVVSGVVQMGAPERSIPRSVRDPALYAGSVLKWQLQAHGVTVAGRVRRSEVELPVELLSFEGRSLSEVVVLMMKYSNNAMAEMLVKSMGARAVGGTGRWPNGLAALKQTLTELGVWREGALVADGSGLSADNRVSASMLVAALRHARASFRVGPELVSALPIAGRDGTLEDRALGGAERIRAKTGRLAQSRALGLSGLGKTVSGEEFVFSLLVNGYSGSTEAATNALDHWVARLVEE